MHRGIEINSAKMSGNLERKYRHPLQPERFSSVQNHVGNKLADKPPIDVHSTFDNAIKACLNQQTMGFVLLE